MKSTTYSNQWLFQLNLLVIFSATVSAMRFNIPRLSPIRGKTFGDSKIMSSKLLSEDFQTFFCNQTLDHFNYKPESYATFPQRYVINFKYWGGANVSAPIFAYFGAEEPLDHDMRSVGFLTDHGIQFNALLVYIEHRYYGKSIPFGSRKEAMKNASTLGYFNSAQAIADYAEVLIHIKEELQAQKSPVIVIGGSYGGMLASWFRLKYPHIALGALASSAPVLYFDDITPQDGYFSVVSKDFQEASQTCYQTIKNSWSTIDEVASRSDGLSFLSKRFKSCTPLKDSYELKDYLQSVYANAAQYNSSSVASICRGIDGATYGTDTLSRIFAGLVIALGDSSCFVNPPRNASETDDGWGWQTCSEMVIPVGTGNDSMFEPAPFNLTSFSRDCESHYGVQPRPHWVTAFYGGHDIKLILKRFGSHTIFSNGLKDPYSSGGVLEDISDTILAVKTVNGTHCMDIVFAKENDPEWLVNQRKRELEIIQKWITQYYADLLS